MGFAIPETALKVALQEDKLTACREALSDMLGRYRGALDRLDAVERELFCEKINELRGALRPGYSPLNWMSLGILEFVETCDAAITEFSSLVSQVQKNAQIIARSVEEVASSSVVKEPPDGESLLDVTECCEFLDAHRRETIERLQKRYRAIGPLLGKVEELIAGTNTGRSARLRGYYRHWEREMFLR